MDFRPGIGVVVDRCGVQTGELDGVHTRPTRDFQPFGPRQQRRGIPGGQEPSAQLNGRKDVPGIRSGNHGDPHTPTLPQRLATTLTAMTDQVSRTLSDVDHARTVETFLYALQDEDFDTAEALMSEHLVWQNVGYPTLRGRRRIMKLVRSGQGRAGFEVKIHRIVADGNEVLTERTDALIFGPIRLQFWVCGTFEVHDGQVTLWRDYFDAFTVFVKAPLRALAGLVVPSLKPTM
jgi:limonene-1,2-epoxide hydrolase